MQKQLGQVTTASYNLRTGNMVWWSAPEHLRFGTRNILLLRAMSRIVPPLPDVFVGCVLCDERLASAHVDILGKKDLPFQLNVASYPVILQESTSWRRDACQLCSCGPLDA